MPTYQYACTECGDQLEMVQKFSDDPLTVCPACSGRLRKVFSPVGIVFKGSGFYRTDSRAGQWREGRQRRTAKTTEAAGSGPKSEGSGGKADKGEKKPAASSTSSSSSSSSKESSSRASSSGSTSEKVA